jgi:glutathione synthase
VGIDVIDGRLSEINVTSPTGIRELDQQFGLDIGGQLVEALLSRLAART